MITLDSYLEDNSVDLVDSILTDPDGNAYSYSEKASKAIWAMYRYAPLNCCNDEKHITRWIQRGRDIVYNLDERYSQLFNAYEALKTAGTLNSLDIEQTTETDITQNQDGSTTGSDSSSNEQTSEAIPQYADASSGTWLTGRNKGTASGSTNGTSNSKATTKGTVTTKGTNGAIVAEVLERYRASGFNPYMDYAGELRTLWIPFFFDECGCYRWL